MRKQLRKGMVMLAGCVMMGLPQVMNAASAEEAADVYRLDSVVTRTKDEVISMKRIYGYDDVLRKVYDKGISYNQWTTPPLAPTPMDSIVYEYDGNGRMVKEMNYSPDTSNPGTWTAGDYTTYEWNEAGQKVKATEWRYNVLVEDNVDMSMDEYTYAEDGSLEAKIIWRRMQGAPWETEIKELLKEEKVVYSDFLAQDKPRKVEAFRYRAATEGTEDSPAVEEGWDLSTYSLYVYGQTQLLDSIKYYNQDYETKEWEMYSYRAYLYDEAGRLIEERGTMQDYETGEISVTDKTYYEYDAAGNLAKVSGERYQTYISSWVKSDTDYYYYTRMEGGSSAVNRLSDEQADVYYAAAMQQVEVRAAGTIGSVRVYTADGRYVADAAVRDDRAILSTAGMARGLYIVSVDVEGVMVNRKVYVQE